MCHKLWGTSYYEYLDFTDVKKSGFQSHIVSKRWSWNSKVDFSVA